MICRFDMNKQEITERFIIIQLKTTGCWCSGEILIVSEEGLEITLHVLKLEKKKLRQKMQLKSILIDAW